VVHIDGNESVHTAQPCLPPLFIVLSTWKTFAREEKAHILGIIYSAPYTEMALLQNGFLWDYVSLFLYIILSLFLGMRTLEIVVTFFIMPYLENIKPPKLASDVSLQFKIFVFIPRN